MTRAMAVDLGADNIRCNAIAPGWITSDLSETYLGSQPERGAAREALSRLHPLGRVGRPTDVGDLAVYLASESRASLPGRSSCSTVAGPRSSLCRPDKEHDRDEPDTVRCPHVHLHRRARRGRGRPDPARRPPPRARHDLARAHALVRDAARLAAALLLREPRGHPSMCGVLVLPHWTRPPTSASSSSSRAASGRCPAPTRCAPSPRCWRPAACLRPSRRRSSGSTPPSARWRRPPASRAGACAGFASATCRRSR